MTIRNRNYAENRAKNNHYPAAVTIDVTDRVFRTGATSAIGRLW
jgi:hypothetical protein